jgi:hypothetical protein
MPEIKYKYTINALIDSLPKNKNTSWCAQQLKPSGIDERTFYRDKSIAIDEDTDIPGERLLIYSKFFGVELIQLFNKNVKVRPHIERKPTKTFATVAKRTGLQKS